MEKFCKYKNSLKNFKYGFWDIILWKSRLCRDERLYEKKDFSEQEYFIPAKFDKEKPYVVWINHSSFWVKIKNISILTDPVWSKKCFPMPIFGAKRLHKPPFDLEKLEKIDFVLISHNHYDHLDKKTVLKLNKLYPNIQWIVPKGLKRWFLKKNIFKVSELYWWENIQFKDISVTATASQHFSGRMVFDYNNTLWVGYILEIRDKKMYFVGDTGYNENDFKDIGKKYKKIDLSLIPIGAYLPRRFLKPVHINPEEAVKIHKEVNSIFSIGMHWKTFRLSDEPIYLPPQDLSIAIKKERLDPYSFVVVKPGTYVNW